MEYNSSVPIYLQVMMSIKRDIVSGGIKPGEKLPSVRDLAVQYSINPNTVSRVYRELEAEGICFTRRGMGTFVTEDAGCVEELRESMARELAEQFLAGIRKLGFTARQAEELLRHYENREGGEGAEEGSENDAD